MNMKYELVNNVEINDKGIIKIPKYSDSILFSMKPEDVLRMDEIIFSKDKKKIVQILLEIKKHFPNATKSQHIIDKMLNDITILNKCNLVFLTGTAAFMNAKISICPLRDIEQSIAHIDPVSKYRDEYNVWLKKNKGKDFFDFVKENDVEEIYIHINPNSNWRIQHLHDEIHSFNSFERLNPEYADIKFIRDLFKK